MIILTVVLHTSLSQPCGNAPDQNAYDTFLKQHLHKDTPATKKKNEWNTFIEKIKTWDRPIQSFFLSSEASRVIAVCSSGGKRNEGDRCISKEPLTFFTVKVNNKKQVTKVHIEKNQHVILACNKIGNQCLPVHFEANINGIIPDNNAANCS